MMWSWKDIGPETLANKQYRINEGSKALFGLITSKDQEIQLELYTGTLHDMIKDMQRRINSYSRPYTLENNTYIEEIRKLIAQATKLMHTRKIDHVQKNVLYSKFMSLKQGFHSYYESVSQFKAYPLVQPHKTDDVRIMILQLFTQYPDSDSKMEELRELVQGMNMEHQYMSKFQIVDYLVARKYTEHCKLLDYINTVGDIEEAASQLQKVLGVNSIQNAIKELVDELSLALIQWYMALRLKAGQPDSGEIKFMSELFCMQDNQIQPLIESYKLKE